MAVFTPGKTISTRRPVITVDAGLKPGRYYFRLVVIDEQGNRSKMDQALVTIVNRQGRGNSPIIR